MLPIDHLDADYRRCRLLAVLTTRPRVALCMACLVAATGLNVEHARGEPKSPGLPLGWEARCDRCHRAAVVLAVATARMTD